MKNAKIILLATVALAAAAPTLPAMANSGSVGHRTVAVDSPYRQEALAARATGTKKFQIAPVKQAAPVTHTIGFRR